MPNALIHESSPYLLQHAHNPVYWQPWGPAAWAQAVAEHKLVLISIGYSACHWCHVMERESFEDPDTAAIMNAHFVCIKVDREERPDVDQIYMDAVQLMRGQGGWPLNCFTLPDGRPIYGGTYFNRQQWQQVLHDLAQFYQQEPGKAAEYASNLTEAIQEMDQLLAPMATPQFTTDDALRHYVRMSQRFDTTHGGIGGAPKFPVPCNLQFLLQYAHHSGAPEALAHLRLSLDRMARGGIYDQIGGGFARYSVDAQWFAPHFEKMLYDNAQLVSLYADAYRKTHDENYAQVVRHTLGFIERELMHPEGGFYSALDADSEGVEGKYYVWTADEFVKVLGDKAGLLLAYYNVAQAGNWEHGQSILHRTQSDADFAAQAGIPLAQLQQELATAQAKLLATRALRTHPGLDDKVLAGWNAMMCKAYCDAYRALGDTHYLQLALMNNAFVERAMAQGPLLHRCYKNGRATISAYLEDYALNLQAQLALYQVTFDMQHLLRARARLAYVMDHFYDAATGYFFFTADTDAPLIARKKEIYDSVLPSSNAVMAEVLLSIGAVFDEPELAEMATRMVAGMLPQMQQHATGFSGWAQLVLRLALPQRQLAICGPQADEFRNAVLRHYLPNLLVVGSTQPNDSLPLLRGKHSKGTHLYVCQGHSCLPPTTTVADALAQLDQA